MPDNKTRKKKTKTKENVDSVLITFKTTIKRVYQITQWITEIFEGRKRQGSKAGWNVFKLNECSGKKYPDGTGAKHSFPA